MNSDDLAVKKGSDDNYYLLGTFLGNEITENFYHKKQQDAIQIREIDIYSYIPFIKNKNAKLYYFELFHKIAIETIWVDKENIDFSKYTDFDVWLYNNRNIYGYYDLVLYSITENSQNLLVRLLKSLIKVVELENSSEIQLYQKHCTERFYSDGVLKFDYKVYKYGYNNILYIKVPMYLLFDEGDLSCVVEVYEKRKYLNIIKDYRKLKLQGKANKFTLSNSMINIINNYEGSRYF
jgi:hypothetical protein